MMTDKELVTYAKHLKAALEDEGAAAGLSVKERLMVMAMAYRMTLKSYPDPKTVMDVVQEADATMQVLAA